MKLSVFITGKKMTPNKLFSDPSSNTLGGISTSWKYLEYKHTIT